MRSSSHRGVRNVGIGTFGHVSEQGSLDELPVEADEQGCDHAPEQENDGQALRVGGSQTLGVLAIMSEKYDAISTKNKMGKAM